MAPNFLANDFSDFYNYDLQAKLFVINKSIDLHSSYVWKKARTSEYLESFCPVYDLFNYFFQIRYCESLKVDSTPILYFRENIYFNNIYSLSDVFNQYFSNILFWLGKGIPSPYSSLSQYQQLFPWGQNPHLNRRWDTGHYIFDEKWCVGESKFGLSPQVCKQSLYDSWRHLDHWFHLRSCFKTLFKLCLKNGHSWHIFSYQSQNFEGFHEANLYDKPYFTDKILGGKVGQLNCLNTNQRFINICYGNKLLKMYFKKTPSNADTI